MKKSKEPTIGPRFKVGDKLEFHYASGEVIELVVCKAEKVTGSAGR